MHIIILTSSSSASGGLRQALYLAEGLQKQGHEVNFVCPNKGKDGGESMRLARQMGLNCVTLPHSIFEAEKTLRTLMAGHEATVLHAFHNRGVKLAAYLGTFWRILNLPVVCVAHRGVSSSPNNPLPYILPGIRAYLVNSKACANTLPLLWRKGRCHVVSNSIPQERVTPKRGKAEMLAELNIPFGVKIIGHVGNPNPLKGAEQAIRSFAGARQNMPLAVLVLVGTDVKRWEGLCRQLGVAEHVRLLPKVEHVADYMQLFDILLFTSTFIESQPNVIMEAICMDVPVIGSNTCGVDEILPADALFNPTDTKEISAMLASLIKHPAKLAHLVAGNAHKKKDFTPEARLRTMLGHYQNALAELKIQTNHPAALGQSL